MMGRSWLSNIQYPTTIAENEPDSTRKATHYKIYKVLLFDVKIISR